MTHKVKLDGKNDDFDMMFIFSNVKVLAVTDPEVFNEDEAAEVEQIVQQLSKCIAIDKSYVQFPENKHQDTFLTYSGWSSVCKLVKKTDYGKKSGSIVDEIVAESFKLMIAAYIYEVLDKFGYDIESIQLDFQHSSRIDVKFYRDDWQEWKHYPGPWQDWGLEDIEDNEQSEEL